ncbi:lipopolysaccharide biosynthesis protein [Microbacterium sp. 4R-513]|uniref:lipopolysaccharide biosynthesis protein n=1 Tax=Microbacterium sp. 4R-513 TaxID=2567934 RepID=UPI0013E1475B|nr:lipopolysaccharide biosynthesis protein [Microbacterium sp. 4R-513]QIG38555.1 lipopolysaccharide biosynthesis protein [Microbacterium sp. 4R-513]
MTAVQRPPSLGRTASRGAVVTFGGQVIRITIQLLGIVLLARMLSPTDYGVTAMVLAIIGVGEILRDFGLSSAAIQAKTLTAGQRANLFWINVGIGAALTVVVIALAHPIADFYGDDRLVLVTIVLSSTFFLNGFATQFRADLNRSFRFGALATIEIAAQALSLVIALSLAALGWGYWAIVAQQVLQVFFQAVALPIMGGWWPGLPRRGEQMKPLLAFGGGLVGAQVLNYASRNVDSIVIGRAFGAQSLGYYNRAFQLMLLPLNQINAPSTRVALPTLSRLQDQPKRYGEFISFGQTVLLNIVSLVLGFSVAQATDVIAVALGPQWAPTVPLFQILAIAGFFQAAAFASYWVFLSQGLTTPYLWYTIWTRPFVIGLIILGALWGTEGVAAMYLASTALLWPIGLLWLRRRSTAPLLRLFLNGLRTLIVYGLAAAASYASTLLLPEASPFLRIGVGLLTFLAALAVTVLAFPPFRRDIASIIAARRLLARSRPAAAADATDTLEDPA